MGCRDVEVIRKRWREEGVINIIYEWLFRGKIVRSLVVEIFVIDKDMCDMLNVYVW